MLKRKIANNRSEQQKMMKDELERCRDQARKAKRKEFEQKVTFKQRRAVANAMVRNLESWEEQNSMIREMTATTVASPASHLLSPDPGAATPQRSQRPPRTPLSHVK